MADRDEKGRFKAGCSGNPGGRPTGSLTAMIDAAITPDDWTAILGILRNKARRGDLKAIEMLFDRRFGKAQQYTDLTSNGETITVTIGKGEA